MVAAIGANGQLVLCGLAGSGGNALITNSAVSGSLSFPLFARWSPGLPTSANMQAMVQAPIYMPVADFPSALPSGGQTLQQIVTTMKGYANASGKNAGPVQIFMYQDTPVFENTTDTPNLYNTCISNNWRLYTTGGSGSGGSLVTKEGADGQIVPSHGGTNEPIAVDSTTGLWPFQWAAQYLHDRYIGTGVLGTGSLATDVNTTNFNAPALDGAWTDNVTEYLLAAGDWNRSGSSSGNPASSTVIAAYFAGVADLGNYWHSKEAALGTNRLIVGNTSSMEAAVYGYNDAPMSGAFDYTMQQFFFGRGQYAKFQDYTFAFMLAGYQHMIATARAGKCFLTGVYIAGDDQAIRHDMIFTMIGGNGYHMGAYCPAADQSGDNGWSVDYVNPNTPSTWIATDECWGGTLSLGAYLGPPVAGPTGQPQTAAWNGNIWMREFQNGWAFINAGTTSQGPYTLPATGYHLTTVNDQSINNGAAATTISLGTFTYSSTLGSFSNTWTCGDSCILMKSPT